jgi:hypothetical protein
VAGYGVYKYMKSEGSVAQFFIPSLQAAGVLESQPSVSFFEN